MKRSLFTKQLKQTLLAVSASALMLGAAQSQTTVGINFYGAYGGYGYGSLPVSATAFGVSPGKWANVPATDYMTAANGSMTAGPAGVLSVTWSSPNTWAAPLMGDPAASNGPWNSPLPGDPEVIWGYLDDGNATSQAPAASVTGLSALFPHGYVVQTIAAEDGNPMTFANVAANDGSASDTLHYATYWHLYDWYGPVSGANAGTVGLCGQSALFTGDVLSLQCDIKGTTGMRSSLCGFIITDQPVVTHSDPANLLLSTGAALLLAPPAGVIGIGLTYQWQHAGTNIPGATFSSYTNSSVTTTDAGAYAAVVTSSFYPSLSVTGQVANVSVVPAHAARTATFDANTGTIGAQDGSGTWGYTVTNWWSGSADDYWGNPDSAVFGAGGTGVYTVALTASVAANAITFSSGAYTITNTAGETLTLTGSPALTATTNGTITVPLTITTNTLLKLGAGKVTLTGALTSTNIFVGAGTLEMANASNPTCTVTNGATLKIGYNGNARLVVYGDGTAAATGLYLMGGANYNVGGTPTLLGAPTTIRQYGSGLASLGIGDINATGLHCTAAASGSIIDANIQMVSDGYGMTLTVDAGANTTTGDLILNGPLNVGSLGFLKWGTGTLRLNGTATPANKAVNVMGGPVICGAVNCVGPNARLNVGAYGPSYTLPNSSGTSFDLNGFSQTVTNASLGAGSTLKTTIYTGGTPSATVLTTTDPGTALTYGGTLTVTSVGTAPTIGETFTLFISADGYSGAFTNFNLPPFAGLAWDTSQLTVNGSITVIAGSTPPSIVTDLSGGTNYAFVGGNSTLTITAAGDPILHYQWKKNGTTPVGTDSPTLALSSLTLGSAGYYSCTVTNNYAPAAQSQTNYLVVVTPSLAAGAAVQDTPKSLWPLSETDPATAYDYWSGNNGTQNGSLTLGAAGPVPPVDAGFNAGTKAYQFDGASTYIDCGTAPSLSGTTDFTVEAWINTTNTISGQIIQQRSTSGYDGTANGYNGEYGLSVNGNGTVNFYIFGGGSTEYNFNSPRLSRRVNDGKWHHIAAVRSGGTSGFIYIDGSLVASASGTAEPLDGTIATFIGADQRNSSVFFNGSMCNVAIYTTALSADRIGVHAATGVLGTAPLKLNLVAGGWSEDSKPSGTPHDGQNLGTTWVASNTDAAGTPVTRTGVAQFASGAQIAIPADADFNSPTGTICFWMQTALPPAGTGMMLVDRRTSAGMVIVLDGTPSGGIDIQYTGNANFATGGNVTDGNWHHVAVTYDQSASGTVEVFVDGASVGSQANTAASSWPATQEIELGRSHDTYWQEFNGQMDDFRIYNRVLTSTEITAISTPATSDSVLDSTLKVRFNFGTAAGVGKGLSWQQIGVLQSSPLIGPSAVWTPLPTTAPAYPFLPRTSVTNSALFYRLKQ
jgi:hypothetical protein